METHDAERRDFQKRLGNDLRNADHNDEVWRQRRDLVSVVLYSFYFSQQGRGTQIVEGPKAGYVLPRVFIEHVYSDYIGVRAMKQMFQDQAPVIQPSDQ